VTPQAQTAVNAFDCTANVVLHLPHLMVINFSFDWFTQRSTFYQLKYPQGGFILMSAYGFSRWPQDSLGQITQLAAKLLWIAARARSTSTSGFANQ
jgi:hypothetical protein